MADGAIRLGGTEPEVAESCSEVSLDQKIAASIEPWKARILVLKVERYHGAV